MAQADYHYRVGASQMPKDMSRKIVLLVSSVLGLLLAGLYGLDYLLRPDTFPVRQMRFEGEFKHVSQEQLSNAAMGLVKGNFFLMDLDAVKAQVEALPWLQHVSVRRLWPDGVHIRFTEQRLGARWGESAWLNVEGELINIGTDAGPDDLPRLTGPAGMHTELYAHYQRLQALLGPTGLEITSLQLTPRHTWDIEFNNGFTVVIGHESPDYKLARFAQLYSETLAASSKRIRQVDLRYTNGFAVAWRSPSTRATGISAGGTSEE